VYLTVLPGTSLASAFTRSTNTLYAPHVNFGFVFASLGLVAVKSAQLMSVSRRTIAFLREQR